MIRMGARGDRSSARALRPADRGGRAARAALAAALLAATALAVPAAAPAQSSDIPWNATLVISRTSSNDDIRNVLRSILQANGLSVVFGPDVQGPISFQLDRVPIATAFDQLIQQYDLAYTYDPTTRTVMVTSRSGPADFAQQQVSLPLDQESYDQLSEALISLGLGLGGVSYDAFGETITISGDRARVNRITGLLTTMRPDLLMALADQEDGPQGGPEPVAAAAPPPAPAPPPVVLAPQEVEVIPLRFANVGPSTRTFQGREVTVPGIADTLYALMGQEPMVQGARSGDDPNMWVAAYEPPPRISIDQRTNSVVVQGSREQIEQVRSLILQLDRPLQMVQIEVIIANADIGVGRQLGLALRGSLLNPGSTPGSIGFDSGVTGSPIGNPTDGSDRFDSNGLDALNLLPDFAPSASFIVRGQEAALQASLTALASEDRVRILSAPRLVTLDNITARITRAQNIYVQVDTRLEGGGTGGVGLQEIQTGLTLEITPSIVPAETAQSESLVRLDLRAENSAPGSGSFGQIDVSSQEVQTNVLVPNGATYVVGGLFDGTRIDSESGVPGLKEIPVLGALFRTTSESESMRETIFFITPHVVTEQAVLQDDIAVRIGSQDYIDQQRRVLATQYGPDAPDMRRATTPVDVTVMSEDE